LFCHAADDDIDFVALLETYPNVISDADKIGEYILGKLCTLPSFTPAKKVGPTCEVSGVIKLRAAASCLALRDIGCA
jgi:hypothetical protein